MAKTEVWKGKEVVRPDFREQENPSSQRKTGIFGGEEKRSTAQTANVLVLDISASMNERLGRGENRPKIEGVKEAVTVFIANLPATACLSIITFSDSAKVLFELMAAGKDKGRMMRTVQCITAGGTTAMAEGLKLAEKQLRKAPAGYVKRLYALTDGIPTSSDPSVIADQLKQQDVQVHTIGFGEGYEIDEALLQRMAGLSASGTPLYFHFSDAGRLTGFLKRESQFYS